MRRLIQVLLIGGLVATSLVNIVLFGWLNGEGFIQSRDGYWALRTQERGDFRYLIDTHPHPGLGTVRFYLELRDYAEGERVVAPPGLLDETSVRTLAGARLEIDRTYDTVLGPDDVTAWEEEDTITGRLGDGVPYTIVVPPAAPSPYRVMTAGERVLLIPDVDVETQMSRMLETVG